MGGKATPATAALAGHGIDYRLHSYPHDPARDSYGSEAVEALGVAPERVFKTLVADVDGRLTVAVVPMTGQLDTKALAAAASAKKARMADAATTQRATGYVLGGVSPLGQRGNLPTFIDSSATEYGTVFCSAGRRGLEIELAPSDLARLTDATLAAIAR